MLKRTETPMESSPVPLSHSRSLEALKSIRKSKLTLGELCVLQYIYEHPGCTQKEIRTYLDMGPTAIYALIRSLNNYRTLRHTSKRAAGCQKYYYPTTNAIQYVAP